MNKSTKIHVSYIFSILIIIIIILITIKFGKVPELVNQISFALTITSLVLAILAIGYAVYSNNSFSQNISKLDSASDLIKKSSRSLSTITKELNTKFDNIPSLLETIDKKADSTQELLSIINEKTLSNIESKFIESDDIEKESIEKIITNTSPNGTYILYALKLAKDKRVIFDIKDFADKTKITQDYLVGFIQPLTSLGLIKRSWSKTFSYEILGIHDEIENNILTAVKKLWDENQKETHMHFILEKINAVRVYFELTPISLNENFN